MGGWATGLSALHARGVTPFSLRSRSGGRGVGWERVGLGSWGKGAVIRGEGVELYLQQLWYVTRALTPKPHMRLLRASGLTRVKTDNPHK